MNMSKKKKRDQRTSARVKVLILHTANLFQSLANIVLLAPSGVTNEHRLGVALGHLLDVEKTNKQKQ